MQPDLALAIAGQMQPDLGQIVWQQPFFLSYLFFLSLVFDVHALCHEVAQCMHQARAIATKWQLHVHLGHASGPKGPLACPCAFACATSWHMQMLRVQVALKGHLHTLYAPASATFGGTCRCSCICKCHFVALANAWFACKWP